MNSLGFGKAVDNITLRGVVITAASPNMYFPCAAVNPQSFSCASTTNLPPGVPTTIFCQSQGFPNYVWNIQASVTGGGAADNPELASRITVTPADCVSLSVNTTNVSTDDFSGRITVNAFATAGAAVWLRGIEYLPGIIGQTPQNLEDLKTNGVVLFDMVLPGPFNVTSNSLSPSLHIPYTTLTGHTNFYFVADTLALSTPFVVTCPSDVVFQCDQPVVYPLPTVTGGCGQAFASYSPPANSLPIGTTPVTVTVFDQGGNTNTCTFNVTIQDSNPPVITGCPPNIFVQTGPGRTTCDQVVTWTPPMAQDNCGVASFTSTHAPGSTFPVGTTTVTYTARDAAGNTTTCSFNVTVVDNTPPKAPVLPKVTGDCGLPVTLTPPVATDNCAGPVMGTTTTQFPITSLGTTVVCWTFNDGNGNISTANQTVIVSGLNFHGFFSPIGGTGGTCDDPLRTVKLGSTLPVKFKVSCCGAYLKTGKPALSLQQCSGGSYSGSGDFKLVGNDWHFNWDTSRRSAGVYKLIVTLQDGSQEFVFIRLKKNSRHDDD
jgi:hypothetical protein